MNPMILTGFDVHVIYSCLNITQYLTHLGCFSNRLYVQLQRRLHWGAL